MSSYTVELFWLLLSSGLDWVFSVLPTMEEFLRQIGFLVAKIFSMLLTMEEFLGQIGFLAANLPLADQAYK
jgi:uncharacterized protein involved in cysteine biosynthesis